MSLAEALEVRGGPLQEEEIWAVLNQSAESLQELFRKGKCVCGGRGVVGCRKAATVADCRKQCFLLSLRTEKAQIFSAFTGTSYVC